MAKSTNSCVRVTIQPISIFITCIFLFQSIAFALPAEHRIEPKESPFEALINFPESMAHIDESFQASTPLLYLIQDAHTNYSSQMNQARLIEMIVDHHTAQSSKPLHVFTEAGTGDIGLEFLRPFADVKTRATAGEIFLRKGLMQGAEFLSLTTTKQFKLLGIENPSQYASALKIYLDIIKNRQDLNNYLMQLHNKIQVIKPQFYSSSFLAFERLIERHEQGEISILDFASKLNTIATTHHLTPIQTPSQTMNTKALHEWSQSLENLTSLITEKLLQTHEEKELYKITNHISLLKKLTQMRIIPIEADILIANNYLTLAGITEYLKMPFNDSIHELDRAIQQALRFYILTKKRDEHFIKEITHQMQEANEKGAVLITGGYHTPHIKKLLKERNISFISITPMVTEHTHQARYEQLLLNQLSQLKFSTSSATALTHTLMTLPLRNGLNDSDKTLALLKLADYLVPERSEKRDSLDSALKAHLHIPEISSPLNLSIISSDNAVAASRMSFDDIDLDIHVNEPQTIHRMKTDGAKVELDHLRFDRKGHLSQENSQVSAADRLYRVALKNRTPLLEKLTFLGRAMNKIDEFARKKIPSKLTNPNSWSFAQFLLSRMSSIQREAYTYWRMKLEPALAKRGINRVTLEAIMNSEALTQKSHEVFQRIQSQLEVINLPDLANYENDLDKLKAIQALEDGNPYCVLEIETPSLDGATDRGFKAIRIPKDLRIVVWEKSPQAFQFALIEDIILSNKSNLIRNNEKISSSAIIRIIKARDTLTNAQPSDEFPSIVRMEVMSTQNEDNFRTGRLANYMRALTHIAHIPDDDLRRLMVQVQSEPLDIANIADNLSKAIKNSSDFIKGFHPGELLFPSWTPVPVSAFSNNKSSSKIKEVIQNQKFIMLNRPYESYAQGFLEPLRQFSEDPQAEEIGMLLYRTVNSVEEIEDLENNPTFKHFLTALNNGIKVRLLIEPFPRESEHLNLKLVEKLSSISRHYQPNQLNVIYGTYNKKKTHSKIMYVKFKPDQEGKSQELTHISTGNYNSNTAGLYEDDDIWSSDPLINASRQEIFERITSSSNLSQPTTVLNDHMDRKIHSSPDDLLQELIHRIYEEIENERQYPGTGRIIMQVNNLQHPSIVSALNEAAKAGIKISLLVREVSSIGPRRLEENGVVDLVQLMHPNIQLIFTTGRVLPHARRYHFANASRDPKYGIGSSDLQESNLDERVETLAFIDNAEIQKWLQLKLLAGLASSADNFIMGDNAEYYAGHHSDDQILDPASSQIEPNAQAPILSQPETVYLEIINKAKQIAGHNGESDWSFYLVQAAREHQTSFSHQELMMRIATLSQEQKLSMPEVAEKLGLLDHQPLRILGQKPSLSTLPRMDTNAPNKPGSTPLNGHTPHTNGLNGHHSTPKKNPDDFGWGGQEITTFLAEEPLRLPINKGARLAGLPARQITRPIDLWSRTIRAPKPIDIYYLGTSLPNQKAIDSIIIIGFPAPSEMD